MKVAIITPAHPYSGIGKYAFNLFERLYRQDRDIYMLYCETPSASLECDHDRIKVLKQRFPWPFKGRNLLPQYYYFPSRIPRQYDIYHVTVGGLSRVAKFRSPTVITHMDIAPLLFPKMYPLLFRIWCKLVLRHYKNAQKIIAISEKSRDELLSLGIVPEERIKVVHLGYDEELYQPMPKQEARRRLGFLQEGKIILNVGTEDVRKDIPALLKAVYNLQQTMSDLILLRVGETDRANEELKKQIMIKQYQDIPEAQMPLFYNSADVFAFPSIYEGGIAYPPMEAMACGIPTIVTSALKLFQDGCAMVPAQDADALTVTMREVLTSPERCAQLSSAALKEAQKYTLSREADETYKVYEEVFNER